MTTQEIQSFTETDAGPFVVFVNGVLSGSVVKAVSGSSGFALQVFKSGDGHEMGRNTLFGQVRIFKYAPSVVPTETLKAFLERYGVSRAQAK
jgi:hypothetical protein